MGNTRRHRGKELINNEGKKKGENEKISTTKSTRKEGNKMEKRQSFEDLSSMSYVSIYLSTAATFYTRDKIFSRGRGKGEGKGEGRRKER